MLNMTHSDLFHVGFYIGTPQDVSAIMHRFTPMYLAETYDYETQLKRAFTQVRMSEMATKHVVLNGNERRVVLIRRVNSEE